MDNKNVTGRCGGVKVTYIETQFVTSDAAGFKDLVQRLTGRSAPLPPAPHRPLPCRHDDGRRGWSRTAAAGAGPQGTYQYPVAAEVRPAVISSTPPYLEGMVLDDVIGMGDFSDLFYVGAASERSDGCYGGFPH
ncbi:unnamed protein product [Miscanthus lutarioriparius]|uniref:VQ domain-containing protein n=1 Tax=Miscanthus lutarioriparius TaxID=422564 RepID=A0A811Q3R5_9POAL|nr:unnamed protein product [Miscanthus lutarioriparius]